MSFQGHGGTRLQGTGQPFLGQLVLAHLFGVLTQGGVGLALQLSNVLLLLLQLLVNPRLGCGWVFSWRSAPDGGGCLGYLVVADLEQKFGLAARIFSTLAR